MINSRVALALEVMKLDTFDQNTRKAAIDVVNRELNPPTIGQDSEMKKLKEQAERDFVLGNLRHDIDRVNDRVDLTRSYTSRVEDRADMNRFLIYILVAWNLVLSVLYYLNM